MSLSGKAKLAGVIGWPVGHSWSPRLHGHWLEFYGIDGAYVPLPVRPADFAEVLRALPRMGFSGANVTLPHKETALALVDHLDPLARRIGAVNTLIVRSDGSIEGRNTDAFGFRENLRHVLPGLSLAAGPAVVVGAGGAARAVVAALEDAGAPEIRLVNRTRERAENLAKSMGALVRVIDWEQRHDCLADTALLVNTTTQGMSGQPPLPLLLDRLPLTATVTDLVYVPLETPLLADARRRGLAVVDGLGMLLHQARPGFEAWFGVMPEVTDTLRRFVEA
ncbi:shikimate dehydrogenase [Telmatospirillum sp.]|uniref:shikimate dehydrogenase n=1 Tax=Telmatospirillum sp. TaxID=2079197 RepID=UPI002849CFC7|nr:shikimate dehydrogenase [Telmatospirillum sp.]MDR3439609.1 shikimate dehydrogenase [Telmatospirillum sp.]